VGRNGSQPLPVLISTESVLKLMMLGEVFVTQNRAQRPVAPSQVSTRNGSIWRTGLLVKPTNRTVGFEAAAEAGLTVQSKIKATSTSKAKAAAMIRIRRLTSVFIRFW